MQETGVICIASLFGLHRGYGGILTHSRWLMRYFEECGIPHIYVSPYAYHRCIVYPVFAARCLFKRYLKQLSTIWFLEWHYCFLRKALVSLMARQRIEVINAQDPLSALAALRARDARRYPCRIVLTVHMSLPSLAEEEVFAGKIKRTSRYYARLRERERYAFLHVDKIIFPSAYIREAVLKEYPELKDGATDLIYYGIGGDSKDCHACPAETRRPDTLKLITIGTLCARKNQKFLFSVMQRLVESYPRLELHLIGDGEDRGFLEKLAQDLKIRGHVRFRGHMPDARRCAEGAYLYLHSSLAENCPFAIIEAMSCGVPIVAFPVGGIPEMVAHGYNGILVEERSVDAYARSVEGLLIDEARRHAMSAHCRQVFNERFSYKVMGKKYLLCMDAYPQRINKAVVH